MMKCKYCGSNLTIDDAYCPYCGKPNSFAVKHRKQMQSFRNEYNDTKEEVIKKSNYFNGFTVKLTAIAILVALNVGVLLLLSHSWEIKNILLQNEVAKNLNAYTARLDSYEKNDQFMEFRQFFQGKDLTSADALEAYQNIYNVCSDYSYFYIYFVSYLFDAETNFSSKSDNIEFMCNQIEQIYNHSTQNKYDKPEEFSPTHTAAMQRTVAKMEVLVQVYFNLTDDEMEQFPSMSNARRQVLLEEGRERSNEEL